MKTFELQGQLRSEIGKKDSKAVRREGGIPCVLYGGAEPVHFSVHTPDVRHLVYTPHVYFVELNLDGKKHKAVLKDMQTHPVSDAILHIDFQSIQDDKPVAMAIPVSVVGNSPGVRNGGKLVVNLRKLAVSALPKNMPDQITVDISSLNIGDGLRIREIQQDGVTFLENGSIVITAVRMTRSARSAQAAADSK
jgi:large subunit ribosomal protein L25